MKTEIIIKNLDDIDRAAKEFIEKIGDRRIIAFYAPMGAGKTTFTTALCHRLGVEDAVCSPTFTIINEYLTKSGQPVYHFDFYRIDSIAEAINIGLDEYFTSDALCFVEWPEKAEELLPDGYIHVTITPEENGSRTVRIE